MAGGVRGATDRVVRQAELLVDVRGTQAVHDLTTALRANRDEQDTYTRSISGSAQDTRELIPLLRQRRTEELALLNVLDAVEEKINTGRITMQENIKSTHAAARAVLEFSRGFEDFVAAGPIGALNNIPTLVYNIASSMNASTTAINAWTAGLSLAATGVYALWRNWDQVKTTLGFPEIRNEATRLEDLAQKTKKTAEEQAEYNRLKQQEAQINSLLREQSEAQKGTTEAVREAIAETGIVGGLTGAQRLLNSIVQARAAAGQRQQPTPEEQLSIAIREARAQAAEAAGLPSADRFRAAADEFRGGVQSRIQGEEVAVAQRIARDAMAGGSGLTGLINMVRQQPGAFAPGLLGGLVGAQPDVLAFNKEMKDQIKLAEAAADDRQRFEQSKRNEAARMADKDLRDQEKAQKELDDDARRTAAARERELASLARENRGVAGEMERHMTADIARGATMAQMQRGYGGAVSEMLRQAGTVPADMIADVAARVIGDAVRKIAPKVAAVGPETAMMGLQLGQFDAKAKMQGQMARRQQQQELQYARQLMMAQGANLAEARQYGPQMLRLLQQGLNASQAMQALQVQHINRLMGLEGGFRRLVDRVNRMQNTGSSRGNTNMPRIVNQ